MASKRYKAGRWRYCVKRKGVLPKPINLTFDSEEEGDAYCARLARIFHHPNEIGYLGGCCTA